jgi:glycosyltransferase involved in cell wall biosynthesis
MKVLHISNTNLFWDYRIQREMKAVSKVEHIAQLYGVGVNFDEGAAHQNIELKIKNLDIMASRLPRIKLFKLIRAGLVFLEFILRSIIEIILFKPDIIHCHDTPALLPTRLCRFFMKFRIIYDAHELMTHKAGNTKITTAVFHLIEKFSWNRIDGFITVGEAIKEWYFTSYNPKDNAIIYNAPTPAGSNDYQFSRNYLREVFGIADNDKVFAFVGQFSQGRGIKKILKTFENLPLNTHVIFLGYGELESEIKLMSDRCLNIHLHPAIEHEHVVTFLKLCDYGLCLIEDVSKSDRLCLPNKLFEYMQAELPILASDLPEIKMVVNELQMGELVANDADEVSEAVKKLLDQNFEIESTKLVEYLWPAQEKKLIELYERQLFEISNH